MGVNCSSLVFPNPNISEHVHTKMGHRCLEESVALTTSVVYPIILVLGLLGNFCTCLLIAKNKSMHTATNYYLFSLAISDVLQLLLGLPFELYSSLTEQYPYEQSLFLCKGRAYLTEAMSYASILTITAFSVERWLAICFPLKIQIFSRLSRAIVIIITTWIVASFAAAPVLYFMTINKLTLAPTFANITDPQITDDGIHIKNTDFCALEFTNESAKSAIINYSFWLFFCLPLFTISLLYLHIGFQIRAGVRKMKETDETMRQEGQKRLIQNRESVIRMLVAVVLAFGICWLPYHAQRIMILYVDWENVTPSISNFYQLMFYLSGYFYYANSAVNPLLYSLLSGKFRAAFMGMFCTKYFRGSSADHPSTTKLQNTNRVLRGTSNIQLHSRRKGSYSEDRLMLNQAMVLLSKSHDNLLLTTETSTFGGAKYGNLLMVNGAVEGRRCSGNL